MTWRILTFRRLAMGKCFHILSLFVNLKKMKKEVLDYVVDASTNMVTTLSSWRSYWIHQGYLTDETSWQK